MEKKKLFTLEPPRTDPPNQRGLSRIPAGNYKVRFLKKSASGKYRNVYYVYPTSPRTGILIHKGNTARDTRGCLLVGSKSGRIGHANAVLASKGAMTELRTELGQDPEIEHDLEIVERFAKYA